MRGALLVLGSIAGFVPSAARAADVPEERKLSTEEIEQWLDAPSGPSSVDTGPEDAAEAPPPAPRAQGISVESAIGAFGHLGALKNVTPTSPWFHLKAGFEPLSFLLLFGETDLVFSNTRYARRPPPTRTYRLYGFGGGARLTVTPLERLGIYVEASAGAAKVSEDVLNVYGYQNADELNFYFGGRLGLEWYPVNPHLALGLHGGVRSYSSGLRRERSSEPALSWLAGPSIRYTF